MPYFCLFWALLSPDFPQRLPFLLLIITIDAMATFFFFIFGLVGERGESKEAIIRMVVCRRFVFFGFVDILRLCFVLRLVSLDFPRYPRLRLHARACLSWLLKKIPFHNPFKICDDVFAARLAWLHSHYLLCE